MVVIILAAGYATRLYPLTKDRPKALLEIGDKTILDYIMEKLGAINGITKIVVVCNNKFYGHFDGWRDAYLERERAEAERRGGADRREDSREDSRDDLRDDSRDDDLITGPGELIVLNDGTDTEETRLGAIGDIQFAIDKLGIDDEIMVIAGDNFFTFELRGLYDFYRRMEADCVIVKRETDRETLKGLGVAVVSEYLRVQEIVEKPDDPKSDLGVYAVYIYRRETLPLIARYLREGNPKDAPGHFPAWLCRVQRVVAYIFDGECHDIGTKKAYDEICAKYAYKLDS